MRFRDAAVSSTIPYGLIFLLSCTFLVSSEFVSSERRNEKNPIREYLARRLRQTKVEIAKEYIKAADTEWGGKSGDTVPVMSSWHYDIRSEKVWSRKLKSERALTFGILNEFFILEGNRVMSIVASNDTHFSSSEARLRNVDQTCLKRSVKFAKSIVWKSTLYLLVCYQEVDACILYTGNNYLELENRQYIINKGGPVDATFFTRANRLYLVVARNTEQFPVSSIVYRWTGTYMDIIKLIETLGAVSVTAFNYKRSSIIIFGQNEKTARSDVGSEIYRFDDNTIEKIQYLSTNVPISITHYTHNGDVFLLITNEKEASSVYWWYGNEFLHWLDLPDIVAPSMLKVVYLNGETLFLVSYENMICLYKITMGVEYSRLNLFEIKNSGEKVVDMSVWIKDGDDSSSPSSTSLLTLLLVTFDPLDNLYRIDSWELRITKIGNSSSSSNSAVQEAVDATEQCLAKLEDRLERVTVVLEDSTRRTWPILLGNEADVISIDKIGDRWSTSEDKIIPMGVEELILHSGISIGKVDILSTDESDEILLTNEMLDAPSLTSILDDSRKRLRVQGDNRLTGNVTIEGDTMFSEFAIDAIDIVTLNEKVLRTEQESSSPAIISASKSQIFSKSKISGRNITVGRLEIDNLCGIPYDHWLVRRENHYQGFDEIWAGTNPMESIVNDDTVVVSAANSLKNVELRSIDGIRVSDWLDNIFIVGKRQRLEGNIYQRTTGRWKLDVDDLAIHDSVNGIPHKDLITRVTEQNISGHVFIDTMSMENILATRINGIMVESGAAMISKENHITGQVSMANLKILEELAIDDATKFREVRPVQVYDRVTISGNVKARELVSELGTNFNLSLELIPIEPNVIVSSSSSSSSNNKNSWNVDSIVHSYWTKSTNQMIKKRVVLANGLSIDELKVQLLNDIDTNEDILLTNVRVIDDKFGPLELTNFTVKGSILDRHKNNDFPLYQDSEDTLEFNQILRIEQLRVEQLYIGSFNGIPIDDIMRREESLEGKWTARYNSTQTFETISVKGRIEMEHLDLRLVNGVENKAARRVFRYDENYEMDNLEAERLSLGEVEIELGFGSDGGNGWRTTISSDYISSLAIEGDALVEKEARIETIDRLDPWTYVNRLATKEWTSGSEDTPIIDNLNVRHDLTLNYIRGSHLESLWRSTFSKSRVQNLTDSRISFFGIAVANSDLKVERINKRNVLDLVYLDSYDVNFGSDLVLDELTILGDIRTRYVNDYAVAGMYDQLGRISSKFIDKLRVEGNVWWRRIEEPGSIDTIIGHAVGWKEDRNDDILALPEQRIVDERISIEQPTPRVLIASVNVLGNVYGAPTNIREIISDSVLDDWRSVSSGSGEIRVGGEKSFVEDVDAGRLNVTTGQIGIEAGLNLWQSIDHLKSSIVRLESLKRTDLMVDEVSSLGANAMLFRNGIEARKLTIRRKELLDGVRGGNSINSSSSLGSSLLVHGLPISGMVVRGATIDDDIDDNFLPNGTFFNHLLVRNNVFVQSLDSIDFNEFANNRVVVNDKPSSSLPVILVDGNIRFNGRVRVSENASIGSINGIIPSDLVVNVSSEKQTIAGNETRLYGNMMINGKTYAPLVGGIRLKDEYSNAVLNHEDVEIFGDIIFQSEYTETNGSWKLERRRRRRRRMRNASEEAEEEEEVPSGLVNEIELRSFIETRDETEEDALRTIAKNESLLETGIARAWRASNELPEILIYLEAENNLRMSGPSGIERVRVTRIEDTTILAMYGNVVGSYCNLRDECPCRRQYVAEISSNDCRTWSLPPWRIFYYFHETNGRFAVSIATSTVSSSKACTRSFDDVGPDPLSSSNDEFTTISWIKNPHPLAFKNDDFVGSNVTKDAIKIYNGYMSDARVFTQNDLVFIVLAIYYDPEGSTHRTNSLIYMLDIATNAIKLVKTIRTDHAGGVHVFKIPNKGPHILFTSLASSIPDSPAESLLYRLDPVTAEFRLLRSLASGGNRIAKSVSQSKDEFLLLDDIATNSINVYRYDVQRDNFYFHQSIYHNSMAPIVSIQAFYTGEFRHSDVYVIVTTERDRFFVYRPELMGKFQLTTSKRVNGILSMVPFDVAADRRYMFVGTDTNSTILRIVEEGSSRT